MEAFTLATVSLIIAVSLLIYKKDDPLKRSYAFLCLAISFFKIASLLGNFWKLDPLILGEKIFLLSLPPLTVRFTQIFLKGKTLFASHDFTTTLIVSATLVVISLWIPPRYYLYGEVFSLFYVGYVLFLSYLSLLFYVRKRARSVEKRRLGYLVVAVPIALGLWVFDLWVSFGLSNLVIAALLYFILLIIAYPHLTELHELMAKALVISITTGFAVFLFYLVMGLFNKGRTFPLPFTYVLLACFTIVISISPFKVILEKLFKVIYPESKDVFTSLYALDAKLEREKALLLEEMAPVLAHEIRNPLGSIKGAAQFLYTDAAGESKKLLGVIIEEVDRLNSVVSQFLDYAKPHALNLKIQDINKIVERAVSLIRANGDTARISWEMDFSPALPMMRVDEEQILQLMLNMIMNAIDAMPEGGTLRIKTLRGKLPEVTKAVGIIIQDTGHGMGKEELKNIFKPFFTTKKRGVGLGLAICQKIVKNHGGYIRVKSMPGKGTIFYICIGSITKSTPDDEEVTGTYGKNLGGRR